MPVVIWMECSPRMTTDHDAQQHWERSATDWINWARTPGHDAYWAYREELRRYLPSPGRATLDLGCGEGRVARDLTDLGHHVTAVEPVAELLAAAEEADSAAEYVPADATALPFDDDSFDRVVAYNMLMDVADMPGAVSEAARVLRDDGEMMVSIVHPIRDLGGFASDDQDAPFLVTSTYFGEQCFDGVVDQGGLRMHFAGWYRPLETYVAALGAAGLAITSLREPKPSPTNPARPSHGQDVRLPLFLWLTARPLR